MDELSLTKELLNADEQVLFIGRRVKRLQPLVPVFVLVGFCCLPFVSSALQGVSQLLSMSGIPAPVCFYGLSTVVVIFVLWKIPNGSEIFEWFSSPVYIVTDQRVVKVTDTAVTIEVDKAHLKFAGSAGELLTLGIEENNSGTSQRRLQLRRV